MEPIVSYLILIEGVDSDKKNYKFYPIMQKINSTAWLTPDIEYADTYSSEKQAFNEIVSSRKYWVRILEDHSNIYVERITILKRTSSFEEIEV